VFTEAEKIEMVNLHNEERKLHGGNQLALVSTNIVTYSLHVSIDYETELCIEYVGSKKWWAYQKAGKEGTYKELNPWWP